MQYFYLAINLYNKIYLHLFKEVNQDLNYLMEVIKDRKDELSDLTTKCAEIADKESTEIILERISAIHDEIVDIDAKIRALGDIDTLCQNVNNWLLIDYIKTVPHSELEFKIETQLM